MQSIRYRENDGIATIKIIFSIFLALYPILCLYTGFFRFTIGDVGLIMFTIFAILPPVPRQDTSIVPVAFFLITTIIVFFVNLFVFKTMPSWAATTYFFRLAKLVFYLMAAFFCGKKFFDSKSFEKAVVIIGCAAAAFMFFQYVAFYLLGKVYLGHIPGLEIYIEEYALGDYEEFYSKTFRPCSFFLEPAMFAQYMIVPTGLVLFSSRRKALSKILLIIIFSLSIVMSTSAQGIAYLGILFLLYIFWGSSKKTYTIVLLFVFVVAIVILQLFSEPFRFAVNRLLFSEDALSARIGTYEYIAEMDIPFKIIGYGYGVVPHGEYMAGVAYVWYGCGFIGVLLVLTMFLTFFKKAQSKTARVICLIFFMSFFVTSLFYNYMLFWFVCFIISHKENRHRRHHNGSYYRRYEEI